MKKLLIAFLLVPSFLFSQLDTTKGIKWTTGLSWEQIKAKAKAENKYIFVDAYATWCVPCKQMDKEVFPEKSVGEVLNTQFISVKIQMDETEKDKEEIKARYAEARYIKDTYKPEGYPCFLFFNPDGSFAHKAIGYYTQEKFINVVKEALTNPIGKYEENINKFKKGELELSAMPALARLTRKLGDRERAIEIAVEYKKKYLDKLNDDLLFTEENYLFIREFSHLIFLDGSKGRFFELFYNDRLKGDSIFGKGTSEAFVMMIIAKEELEDKLWKNNNAVTKTPRWNKLSNEIRTKYSSKYLNIVSDYKEMFYKRTGNWKKFAVLFNKKVNKAPLSLDSKRLSNFGDAWGLNEVAWDIFLHCEDKGVLKKALQWSELSIKLMEAKPNVQCLDTRANLLYKLGRVEEAIAQEQRAIEIDQSNAKLQGDEKGGFVDEFNATLKKMQNGIPTWKPKLTK